MRHAVRSLGVAAVLATSAAAGWAQSAPVDNTDRRPIKSFPFAYTSGVEDQSLISRGIREMMDRDVRIDLQTASNSIMVRATAEQMEFVKQIMSELDRPRQVYRLTYTVNESDSGKRIGSQHFTMLVASGQRGQLKQGNKVPIVTGSYDDHGKNGAQTQLTYLDVGMNFDVKVYEMNGAVNLETKVEQSSIAPEPSVVPQGDPIVRQTVLTQTSIVPLGKPQVLGAIDIFGSTRHLDFEVVAELQK